MRRGARLKRGHHGARAKLGHTLRTWRKAKAIPLDDTVKAVNRRLTTAVCTLTGPAGCDPGGENSHTEFSRYSVKNPQSTIENLQVWSFRVGGYQVCEKWLKHRKGCTLDYADLQHHQKIALALPETIRVMATIDQTIEAHGGWPGAFWGEAVKGIRQFSQGRQKEKPK